MEKRLLLFITLSLLVLFVYSAYFFPKEPEKTLEGAGQPWVKPERGELETMGPETVAPGIATARLGEKVERREGKDVIVETDLYRMVLTTSGARIKSFRLKKYEEAEVKKEVLKEELSRIENQLSREKKVGVKKRLSRERDRLKYLIEREFLPGEGVELVPFDGDFYGDYPLTLTFPAIDEGGELNFALYQSSHSELILDEEQESGTIEFSYVTAEGIEVKRRFFFSRDSYVIGLEIVIENNSSRAIREENFLVAYGPGVGLVEEAPQGGGQLDPFVSWVGRRVVRDRAGQEVGKGFIRKTTMRWGEPKPLPGPVGWVAMRNRYFTAALIPEGEVAGAQLLEKEDGRRWIALKMPPFSLPQGGRVSKSFSLYLGPQDIKMLRQSGPGLEMVVDFGFWSMIARPIHALLKMFYGWFGNYGLSIILLSLTIKLAFYPFTRKSFESMRKMQEDMKSLQPELEALKDKYKNNPQKLNKATMELYKKRGVNPLGGCKGCLPTLFQMPVFFALFPVLNNAIELRQAPFFGWIDDLSTRDPYYVLPILMGVTMFFQQKVTGMGTASGAQLDQAKMMSIIMPIILTFVFFNLPSGIVLYWLCFNVFTILQQSLVKKKRSI
ncbi:membrane protein insertase YidC [candidate division NPL-UPA2 bacterium]|nr:membrane protein insertase YidC [candidate division NPL-UPA2 bacterium]